MAAVFLHHRQRGLMTCADCFLYASGGDLQLASFFTVLRVDLHGAGHTCANPCLVGRQGAPPSREERGGGGREALAPKPTNVGRGSPQVRFTHGRQIGDEKEQV